MGGVRARVVLFGSNERIDQPKQGSKGWRPSAASVRWVLLRTHGAPSALLRPEL